MSMLVSISQFFALSHVGPMKNEVGKKLKRIWMEMKLIHIEIVCAITVELVNRSKR